MKRTLRILSTLLASLALILGLTPAAHAQQSTTRIGNFDFTVTLNAAESDLRPGGHVRFNLQARNHQVGFPWTPSVMNTMGLVMPDGFTARDGGGDHMGSRGNHGQGDNYYGGQPSLTDRSVGRRSTRQGWLSFNIPQDAVGGEVYRFGLRVNLETFQNWQPTREDVIRFTLPAVQTNTTVKVEPATVEEGGSTLITATVSQAFGTNEVENGQFEFFLDGRSLGRAPVVDGTASIPFTTELLDNRDPVQHAVTARFLGDSPRFRASASAQAILRVEPVPKAVVTSTVTLTAQEGRVEEGQLPVELSMEVETSNGLDLPTGSQIEIRRNGTVIATVPVNGINATYTDSVPAEVTEIGSYTYTATLLENETYDTVYAASEPSNAVDIVVAPEFTPGITVESELSTLLVGQSTDLSARLTQGGDPLPAGQEVTFRVNGRDVGTVTTDANGTAVLPDHVFRTAGEKTIVAHFDGATIGGTTARPITSSPITVTVEPLPGVDTRTTIDLTTEVTAGDEVTMTAHVARADGSPLAEEDLAELGSVWFFDGDDAIGSAPVEIDPETGRATAVFVHRFSDVGEHRITAEYSGAQATDEVLAPSETDDATVVTVSPTEIVIDDPRPPRPGTPGGGGGSLDLGSLMGGGEGGTGGSAASLGGGEGGGSLGGLMTILNDGSSTGSDAEVSGPSGSQSSGS